MSQHARLPAVLGAWAFLTGCEQATAPGVRTTQDPVLRGTESSKDFGDHTVYFNALNTDQLTFDVAREYGIVRSKNRAILTVSIHRKQEDGLTTAVPAVVSASAVNDTGQLKKISLREIMEGDAIYYIGELAINHAEILIYTINVTPADEVGRFTLRFQKQFFVD